MWRARSLRGAWIAVVLLTVGVGTAYVATAWSASDGPVVLPLDDAYVTLQYARQLARGHAFQYNDGDPATTGMTSLLYGLLIAALFAAGVAQPSVPGLAVGSGLVWLGLTAYLTYRLARRLATDRPNAHRWGLIASVLAVLVGPVQWASFNGMETGLFTVLTLAALDALLVERFALCALWSALAALTRPEGLMLAVLVCGTYAFEGLRRPCSMSWRPFLLLVGAVITGLTPSLVGLALTDSAASTGLLAKSWWYSVPRYPAEIFRSVLLSWRRIAVGQFLGWTAPVLWFLPPGVFALALVGWVGLGYARRWRALFVTVTWLLAGTLATATLITATWHVGRYQAPFAPVVVALAVLGLSTLWRRWTELWQRVALALGMALLLMAAGYTTLNCAISYRQALRTIVRQQRVIAQWLRTNLPAGARVGVHDTGALRYLGDRPTYDLIGLTTAGAALPWRHGAGSAFETMEDSLMRPDYFALYPNIFSVPYLAATDLFAERMFRVKVPDYAVASAGPIQCVWRAEWRLAGSGTRFYQPDVLARTAGTEVVDSLDVADLDDEAAHNVTWWNTVRGIGFPTELWQFAYRADPGREVLDGGRLLSGGIAFDVATSPGKPLWLVARLHAQGRGAVQVEVDGEAVGRWSHPPLPGWWLETVFQVPAEQVSSPRTRITLSVDPDSSAPAPYSPYHFWFLQGEPNEAQPTIDRREDIAFATGIRLLGYNLARRKWRPGEAVSMTLFWQAEEATDTDAKVFIHLFGPDGDLVTQADGWAYFETRPAFTWYPGEIVSDPRVLLLPGDALPGTYTVEVGLYFPDGSPRLPAYRDGARQQDGHVPLATIQVAE
jgi:hypothetical protein